MKPTKCLFCDRNACLIAAWLVMLAICTALG